MRIAASFLYASVLIISTVSSHEEEECPKDCDCTREDRLTCRDMTSFPEELSSHAEIVSLYLSNFSSIPYQAFSHLPNMKILDIYSVNIGRIESCAFQNLHNMSRVTIYNANIGTIKTGAFKGLYYDGYFSLYMSQIDTIEPFAFSDISKTRAFSLFNSNITTIESRAFYKFYDLTKFSIYSSNITSIRSGAFMNFSDIETVTIQENNIDHLECNTVDVLADHLGDFFSFDRIMVNCDCKVQWLRLAETAGSGLSLNSTVCKYPRSLNGMPLRNIPPSQLCPGVVGSGTSCPPLTIVRPPICEVPRIHAHDHDHSGANDIPGKLWHLVMLAGIFKLLKFL